MQGSTSLAPQRTQPRVSAALGVSSSRFVDKGGSKLEELLTQEAKPSRESEVLCQKMGDEVLLYPLDSSALHVLNRTAFAIWELSDGKHTVAEIEQAIREQFVIPDPQIDIASDIQNTLQMLVGKGLVRIEQA